MRKRLYKTGSFVLREDDMNNEIWQWICSTFEIDPEHKHEPYPTEIDVTMILKEVSYD
tara:strand:- start:70 stop:243 length:174 start_codon:yes stop_codon:yes gene_type:complete